jgi:cell division protein FtsI/penicillin-binding protein 2
MLKAASAIANQGKIFRPFVVQKVISADKTTEIQPKLEGQVVSANAAKLMSDMMVNAVDNGEAKWAKPKGFKIAGKTGTAQIAIAGHYDAQKTNASFIGFAPADNPKFLMLVILNEPTTSPWGSETAAPLWFDISRELFNYYGVMPQE